jgi:REP element-mobilizing transposase RayT
VIAYHLIWTGYGWWLPNDRRGSGSKEVRRDILAELGELHYGRKRAQPAGRDVRQFYENAAPRLQQPLLTFDEAARTEIASAFAEVVARQRYTCYTCAVMSDHVHVLTRKHRDQAEDMIESLKEASKARLRAAGRCPPAIVCGLPAAGGRCFSITRTKSGGQYSTSSATRREMGYPRSGGRSWSPTTAGRCTRATARIPPMPGACVRQAGIRPDRRLWLGGRPR